jgi:catabolite regulation protein CreA
LRDSIGLLDVVALTADVPDSGLVRGQVGTVVEVLSEDTFEIEFVDDAGLTYALCPIPAASLMVLHYEPSRVA